MRRSLFAITTALLIVLALVGAPASAASDGYVEIWRPNPETNPAGFSPDEVTIPAGVSVTWWWMQGNHRVRDENAALGFINSPRQAANDGGEVGYNILFRSAGTYNYICTVDVTMTGRVHVPPSGQYFGEGDIVVRWASERAPEGYVYDIQIREQGEAQWRAWKTGVRATNTTYDRPDGEYGPQRFRARTRRVGVGATSWSPVLKMMIY